MQGANTKVIGTAIARQDLSSLSNGDRAGGLLGGITESDRLKRLRDRQEISDNNAAEAETGKNIAPTFYGRTGTANRTSAVNAANLQAVNQTIPGGTRNGLPITPTTIPDKGTVLDQVATDGIGNALLRSGLNLAAPGSNPYGGALGFGLAGLGAGLNAINSGLGGGSGKSGGSKGTSGSSGSDGDSSTETSRAERIAKNSKSKNGDDLKTYLSDQLPGNADDISSLINELKGVQSTEERTKIIQEYIDEHESEDDNKKAKELASNNPLSNLDISIS